MESGLGLDKFPEAYRRLSYTQKKVILRDLAYYMVVNGKSTVTTEEAEEKVAQALRFFPSYSESDAPVVCRSLIERSGMLRQSRPGHIDFLHNTFKEYLAAERFVEEGNDGLLAKEALDPAWQPVVLFAVATEKKGFASQLIEQILPSGSLLTRKPRRRKGEPSIPLDPMRRTRSWPCVAALRHCT